MALSISIVRIINKMLGRNRVITPASVVVVLVSVVVLRISEENDDK